MSKFPGRGLGVERVADLLRVVLSENESVTTHYAARNCEPRRRSESHRRRRRQLDSVTLDSTSWSV